MKLSFRALASASFVSASILVTMGNANAKGFEVLYSFQGGSDGNSPGGQLVFDSTGNLYGTTAYGGSSDSGTVFQLTAQDAENQLYSFAGGNDGATPEGLIKDSAGNLYGTTYFGGGGCSSLGCGTVYMIAPDGTEKVLYSFSGGNKDGESPSAPPTIDGKGNLYGTTSFGGGTGCLGYGCGTVYRLKSTGKEKVLYIFTGGDDGAEPSGSLTRDKAGNLYSTTSGGGTFGLGTVFKLAPDGTETVLHSFSNSSDGDLPGGGVVEDRFGNFFGTTNYGGDNTYGVLFEIKSDGSFVVLHSFGATNDGRYPEGVTFDGKGNLYGVTGAGGGTGCFGSGCGTIFKVSSDGTETILHVFKDGNDGGSPGAIPLLKNGYVYSTAQSGGAYGYGTVVRVRQ